MPEEILIPLRDATDRRVAAYAQIDDDAKLGDYRWYRLTSDGPPITFSHPRSPGRPATLAQVILGTVGRDDVTVRYRNGNPLDNRVANLESVPVGTVPPQEDDRERRSRYRGVLWDPGHGQWVAYGYAGGRYAHLGRFDDELTAARAAAAWSDEHQTIHFEDDHPAGGYGRSLRPPSAASEAGRRRKPIGGKDS
jgi:hypothetical protein